MNAAEVHFLLDGEEVRLSGFAPTTTVLEWLRHQAGRSGTKEGCAEGDCGACTVVLAEACDGRLKWRSVNACIQLLATVHGKALYTVESLRARDGTLHPAQQAMVDCHGSQCGFCTPGFVMSLFGLYQTEPAPSAGAIADALSGNLCRCTGYRPIVAAAGEMHRRPVPREFLPVPAWSAAPDPAGERLLSRLASLDDERTLDIVHPHGRLLAPRTLDQFAALLVAHPEATVLAGGTDVGLWITKQFRPLPLLLHLGRVRELSRIHRSDAGLEIGAAVSLEDAFGAILPHYPELAETCSRFASRPIRNAGTLCGNIANGSPIGDSIPVLIALGAELALRRGEHTRSLPLEAFYLDYGKKDLAAGEFVEAVRIPLHASGDDFIVRAWKVSKRREQDISAVFVAFALRHEDGVVTDARIAFGGMAATPARALLTEASLTGRPFDDNALADARAALAEDFEPLSDMRASAAYRLQVARNLLTRMHRELAGDLTRVDAVECPDERA